MLGVLTGRMMEMIRALVDGIAYPVSVTGIRLNSTGVS